MGIIFNAHDPLMSLPTETDLTDGPDHFPSLFDNEMHK
jgi:hypothetical protein